MTPEELLRQQQAEMAAEQARMDLGLAPGEGVEEVTPQADPPPDPFAGIEPLTADPFQKYASRYPVDPTLTDAYMQSLYGAGELRGTRTPLPEGQTQWPAHPKDYPKQYHESGDVPGMFKSMAGFLNPETLALVTGEPDAWPMMSQTFMNMITPDSMEIADMLSTRFPDSVDVRLSPDGIPVVRNKQTGFETVINEPGMSGMDVLQTIGLAGSYSPAGRFAAAPKLAIKNAALKGQALRDARRNASKSAVRRAAGGSMLTESAIQAMQEAFGGDFTTEDIVLSTATGMLPDAVVDPVINAGLKAGEIFGVNKRFVPSSISRAIDFAERNGLRITTSDVLHDTITPARKIFLKAAERVPWIMGTGKDRIRQKAQRADVLENIATEYGLDPLDEYGNYVIQSFTRRNQRVVADAARRRATAFGELNKLGSVPLDNMRKKMAQMRAIADNTEPDTAAAMHGYLDRVEAQLFGVPTEGAPGTMGFPKELSMSFEDLHNYRQTLFKDAELGLNYTGPKGDLQTQLADAMKLDLDEFAKFGDQWANWDTSNRMWREGVDKLKHQALEDAIKSGNLTMNVLDDVFQNGQRKQMRAIYSRLDDAGRQAIRQRLLAKVLHRAGGTVDDLSAAKPGRFVEVLDRDPQLVKALQEFFPGDKYRELMGAKEFLRLTAEADKVSQGVGMTAAMAGGALITGLLDALIGAAALTGTAGKVHESAAVRNLLTQLNYAKGNPDLTNMIMMDLRPLIMQGARQYFDDGRDPFAPPEQPDLFERLQRGGGKMVTDVWNAVSGFRLPIPGGGGVQGQVDPYTRDPARRLIEMQMEMNGDEGDASSP